jgi:DNA-binding NtrC family response regulator
MMKTKLESLVEEMIQGGIRYEDAVAAFEKCFILKALERHQGNLSKTAMFLGIHRNTLSSRVKTYKLVRAVATHA